MTRFHQHLYHAPKHRTGGRHGHVMELPKFNINCNEKTKAQQNFLLGSCWHRPDLPKCF